MTHAFVPGRRAGVAVLLTAAALVAVPAVAVPAVAVADAPPVTRTVDTVVDNTIPFTGCGGAPVLTTFSGTVRTTAIVWADGSSQFRLGARETATWAQDAVTYTVDTTFFVSTRVVPGETTTFVFTGRGSGSDGSTVRMHDVGHVVVTPDGTPRVTFERGEAVCG